MTAFRKFLFWSHLVLGLTAGGVIALVALTGAIMAFQPQILAWAERDVTRVTPPSSDARPMAMDEVIKRIREAQPEARPQSITVSSDPQAAMMINLGRTAVVYVNPYTGAVQPGAKTWREFFQFILRLHRWLALDNPASPAQSQAGQAASGGEARSVAGVSGRDVGGSIVGGAAVFFFVLSVSGLYLWCPRSWSLRTLKTAVAFKFNLQGKARDWNWHTVVGFWIMPVLLVTTLTGTVMAFRPVSDLIYKRPEGEGAGATQVQVSRPEAGAKPLSMEALFAAAKREFPKWETITQRTAQRQRQRSAGDTTAERASAGRDGKAPGEARGGAAREGGEPGPRAAQPATFMIRSRSPWSPVPTQLTLDPYTGAVLQKEGLADYPFRRALRSLIVPVHMGTAGGPAGQIVVFAGALSSLMLVYTGFALAGRRFYKRKKETTTRVVDPASTSAVARN